MGKFVATIKHSSILRKFSILFLLVSIIPLSLLTYIYFQLKLHHVLISYIPNFQFVLIVTVIGIGIGYLAIRRIMNEFIRVGDSSRNSLIEILGPQSLTNPRDENDEILSLTQTFKEIKQRLEKDIEYLKLTKATLHSVLFKVSQAVATARNMDSFLQLIVETATEAFLGKSGLIVLIDRKNNEFYIKSMTGVKLQDFNKQRFEINDAFLEKIINIEKPIIVSNIQDIPARSLLVDSLDFPILCSPLIVRDQPQGLLIISGRKVQEGFQDDDLKLIQSVSLQAAVTLNNEELKHLASVDPLTNIFNYRHLVEMLDYEIARLMRYAGVMSLLIIDIDNFKSYNDTHGHVEGDFLLQTIAKTMRSQVRITDVVCRYAGDEFAIILPGTDIAGAVVVAEKIRHSVEHAKFKQKVTVSIGCAKWVPNLTRLEFIVKADSALYKAKNNNKNNVVCDEDGVVTSS